MSDNEVDREIENHMKKTRRLLPDTFETEDLVEDLKSHIYESYNDKVQKNPDEDKMRLITEVLEELGTPEEIAEEYGKVQIEEEESLDTSDRWIWYTMRLMLAILVVAK